MPINLCLEKIGWQLKKERKAIIKHNNFILQIIILIQKAIFGIFILRSMYKYIFMP